MNPQIRRMALDLGPLLIFFAAFKYLDIFAATAAFMAAVLTAFGAVVAVAAGLAAGALIPLLYGAGFAEGVTAFRILALAFPLMSLNYALTHQVIGWNGHRAYAVLCLGALVFNVALNARLIPSLSLNGAAWSTLATEALLTAGCAAILARARSRKPAAAAAVATT